MPAKSFLGEAEHAGRRFYATVMRGEVSDENVRAYLDAASQIEDIWRQVDDRLAELTAQSRTPWEAYAQLGTALAFIRAARAYSVFVRGLLAADAAVDPATTGYLPRITYDQANALCHAIQPNLQRAVAAFHDPHYLPDVALPLPLGPRIEAEGACPIAHLQGMIAAAREIREWAAGLIAQYANAVRAATPSAPPTIQTHVAALEGHLAQGDSALRFGTDLVGQAFSQRQTTYELHEQAENALWQALTIFFFLNQAVALPHLLQAATAQPPVSMTTPVEPGMQRRYTDRPIRPADLWQIAAPSARYGLQGTEFGTSEMDEMCEKMGGILSAGAQQFLDEVEQAMQQSDVITIAAMANCPFEPLYRARRELHLAGARVPAGHEFHWNYHRGHIESAPRFGRANDWQECEE